ncbi:MAG TPA: hypothetical protein ENK55_12555 [Actinobacteria bacterium]|nr:hypothetical protein [Actinomycetota bacterium]
MGELGAILRIQVQREPLKAPHGWYDPSRIVAVDEAELTSLGLVGIRGGERIVDAHHADHPRSRGGGRRALSVGFRGHYDAMAARFGERVRLGIAGENLVVDGPAVRTEDLAGGLVIVTADGVEVELRAPRPAAPCREFTTFLLGGREPRPRDELVDELEFLSGGTRGFIVSVGHLTAPVVLRVGDVVRVG